MPRKPKINIIVDGPNVTVSGNTANVHVRVQVVGAQPVVTNNTVGSWWKRHSSEIVVGVIIGIIVLALGAIAGVA